jgi:hypothetical protein
LLKAKGKTSLGCSSSNASASLNLNEKSALSLSQLRLVPKVGQWGQLCLRVVYYKSLQVNQLNYPKPQGYYYLQKNTKCYNYYTITKIQQIYKDTRSVSVQQFAKHAPIALTLLDCLHWLQSQKHSRIKESDASPSGILNTLLTHTTTIN